MRVAGQKTLGGLVLASSKTQGGGRSVIEMDLHEIRVPTLIVHHREDGCKGTPPAGAEMILERLRNSPRAKLKFLDGGYTEGSRPCSPGTPHTFHGIESEAVSTISEFIKSDNK